MSSWLSYFLVQHGFCSTACSVTLTEFLAKKKQYYGTLCQKKIYYHSWTKVEKWNVRFEEHFAQKGLEPRMFESTHGRPTILADNQTNIKSSTIYFESVTVYK